MTTPDKNDKETEATIEGITQECFIVPADTFHAIGQYLTQMPFAQVEQLIYGMRMCKAEMLPMKEEENAE